MPIAASCTHCAKTFKVSSKLTGKKAKCTGCGNTFVIAGQMPAPADEADLGLAPEVAAGLTAGGGTAVAAPRIAAPPVQKSTAGQCPHCRQLMDISAIVCVNCGYNRNLGKTMQVQVDRTRPVAPVVRSKVAYSGGGTGKGMMWMLFGGVICALGIIATLASGGNTIYYGAILVGGFRFIYGLVKMASGD